MGKLLSLGFRREGEDWIFHFFREGDKHETAVTDIEGVQEELTNLTLFSQMQQTPEEKAQAEADKRIEDMLISITDNTTDEEKLKLISIYPAYKDGEEYRSDAPIPYVTFANKLYKIIAAEPFISQPSWTPDIAVSLFVEVLPPGTIGEWKQPEGAHDAYMIGDQCIDEGWIWTSIIDNNVWRPSEYPQGWEKEREI